MLVESEVINPAKEKNLIDGVITISFECKLPDGKIIQALGKQSEVPIGIFCSEVFIHKLPVTLIASPGSLDDPRVKYEIAPWSNQSDLFKAALFSRLINITSKGFLETIDWGEADTNSLLDNSFRWQLENTFKNSGSLDESSEEEIKEKFLLPENNECDNNEDNHLKDFFEVCKDYNNGKINYLDKSFPSIASLARELKIRPQTLARRIRDGWPEEKWGEKKNFEIKYRGQSFPSIACLARELKIGPQTLARRIRDGLPEEKWGEKKNFEIKYKGQSFPSISNLAKFLGINPQTLRRRFNRGWPEDKWGSN